MNAKNLFAPVISQYLPEPEASLLNGIIFGIKLKTTPIFYEQLKMVGLLHIVVLSGINITLLAAIVSSFTQNFSKKLSILIIILTIIIFIFFVGPEAPIVRAGIMGILTFVGILFGRKTYPIYLLFISLLIIAIIWPRWLKTISLWLSFGATLGIILFGQVKRKRIKTLFDGFKLFILAELKPSLAAQIFTVPIIFYSFKEISLISPLANLLVSPIIAPLMVFGFLTAVFGKINFYLGLIPAWVCHLMLSYLVFIVETLSKIPGAFIKF